MTWQMAVLLCMVLICGSSLMAWRMWLDKLPACTVEDFQKIVKQVNTLTESMTIVQQTSDSLRSAVGMSNLGVTRITK